MNKIEKEIKDLTSLLNKYSNSYYKEAISQVSDAEYDRLYDKLVKLEKEHPEFKQSTSPTNRVGDDLDQSFADVKHSIPVLSLDKAYSIGEIQDFISRVLKLGVKNLSFSLEEKIDGLSVVLYYKKGKLEVAASRGNGSIGSDITKGVMTIKSVPLELSEDIDIAVRGEIFLHKSSFKRINQSLAEPYANARNLAAGLIKRQKSQEIAGSGLDIFIYEGFIDEKEMLVHKFVNQQDMLSFLSSLGFKTDKNIKFFESDEISKIEAYIKEKTESRASLDYEIDGLVLKVNEFSTREALGYTEHHPRWAVAYKFESPLAKSILKDIQLQVGRTGRVTPVAVFDKTFLLGSYIENASLHNKGYIEELEIAIGDEISFSKRGDVIPQVEEVLEKNECGNTTFVFPSSCPCCGEKLTDIGKNTFCLNKNCPERVKASASFFVSKDALDIEGVGSSTIKDLYDSGLLKDYSDLFYIDFEKELEGKRDYKEKKIKNIIEGLKKAKEKSFLSVLVALQIPECGKKTVQILIDAGFDSMDKFLSLTDDEGKSLESLSSIEGIGPVIAKNIVEFFKDEKQRERVERLRKVGLCFEVKKEDSALLNENLKGQVWCVSGSLKNYKRPELAMEEVAKRGARVVSGVSGKTTHLLVGSKPGSKLEKAKANGKTKIVLEDDFEKYLS